MNYIVHGEESYQVRKAIDAIITKTIGKRDEMNTVVYNALQSDGDSVLADAQTIPFFTEKKCILIQNANFLSANDDTNWNVEAIIDYLSHPMESTVLIFSGDFAKCDMRKKSVKKLLTLCQVSVCNKLDQSSLSSYVKEQLDQRKLRLSPAAFALLCERLPLDIATIQQELDKLELYGEAIDETAIKALVTRSLQEDVFAIVNAVVEKDTKKMFALWEDMQMQNKDPIYLIALISSQFHLLYQVKCATMQGNHAQDEIAQELGVHPYRVKLALRIVSRFSIDTLLHILVQLAELDQSIKSGRIDKKLGFEMFLLQVREC